MNIRHDAASDFFLSSLRRLQSRFETVQRHISSGVRVEKASDAPSRIGDILGRQSDLVRSEQVRENLGRVKAEVDAAEQALQSAISVMERAIVIGTQAASEPSGRHRYDVLAEELASLHGQLVRLSNTTVEGRFVFGGDLDQQAPYQADAASVDGTGVQQLAAALATKQALDIDGSRFASGRTAQEIFDARGPGNTVVAENAFAAIESLRAAALAEDPAAAAAAMENLEAARAYLNSQLGFYGSLQNRIATAMTQSYRLDTRTAAELRDMRETDVAAAAVEMSRLQTNMNASIQSRSTFRMPSLFDFMR